MPKSVLPDFKKRYRNTAYMATIFPKEADNSADPVMPIPQQCRDAAASMITAAILNTLVRKNRMRRTVEVRGPLLFPRQLLHEPARAFSGSVLFSAPMQGAPRAVTAGEGGLAGGRTCQLALTSRVRCSQIGFACGCSGATIALAHRELAEKKKKEKERKREKKREKPRSSSEHRHFAIDPAAEEGSKGLQKTGFGGFGQSVIEKLGLGDHFELRQSPSHDALPGLLQEFGAGSFDLVFIDGMGKRGAGARVVVDFTISPGLASARVVGGAWRVLLVFHVVPWNLGIGIGVGSDAADLCFNI